MGRDQTRVLICAIASLTLIVAGALGMEWFQLTLAGGERIAIDLQRIHSCGSDHACVSRPLTSLSGMVPMLASVTLWSSLGVGALVALQAGARFLTGTAHDAFTRLGYMLSLMAISLAVATAYLFGPDPDSVSLAIGSRVEAVPYRTLAPLVLIAGLAVGFVAVYLAVARESSDLRAAYRPVTLETNSAEDGRSRSPSVPPRPRTPTSVLRAAAMPPGETGILRAAPAPTGIGRSREPTGIGRSREPTGIGRSREPTGIGRSREPTGIGRAAGAGTDPGLTTTQPGIAPIPATPRPRTGSLPLVPEHLRNRLHYVALTAELTGGGIDARREDGLSRLVLWRDVVGVVARRMPPEYGGETFVDVISTAGSTLRILPWTRLTGESIDADGDARPRALIEHVVTRCPAARIDPATRQFLDHGEPAQLPDLETLRAHDDRLA